MTSERIQRRIENLLDEADAALVERDWAIVLDRAQTVLHIDPDNSEALTFSAAAERALGTPPRSRSWLPARWQPTRGESSARSARSICSNDNPSCVLEGHIVVAKTRERSHYQLRMVKRLDGKKLVTHQPLANVKSTTARDKTLDEFQANTDRGALQHARNFLRRSPARQGPLPDPFLGVVVAKFDSDPSKPGIIRALNPYGNVEVINRRQRMKGTTTWLFFVNVEGNAFHVDSERRLGDEVE